jgi:hypothetical protein
VAPRRLAPALAATLAALAAPAGGQAPCPRGELPAYAHNDYANARPLADALTLGYRGAEADVYLVGGVLRLGHDRRAAGRGPPFETTYLRPLRDAAARCGALTATGEPFLLTVELKERSPAAHDTLAALAARYAAVLAPAAGRGPAARPAVEIVLVGWAPAAGGAATGPGALGRQYRIRAPADTLGAARAAADPAVRLLSVDYGKTAGRWWATAARRRRWLAALRAAKRAAPGRRLRVHNAPVDAGLYRALRAAGVDLIGTKALAASRAALAGAGGAGP